MIVPASSETVPPDGLPTSVTAGVPSASESLGSEVAVSDRDVGVLGARGIVVAGDRVVVDARDVDRDVAGVGARAVGQLVVEAALVVAAQVRVRGEGDHVVGEVDGAAGRGW